MNNIRQRWKPSYVEKEQKCVSAACYQRVHAERAGGETYLQELANEGERH